jgi:hypothetical protein
MSHHAVNEHREHPRFAIELDVEVSAGGEHVLGRTHDVSRGGVCMLANQPISVSTPCDVRLALVFSDNQFSEQLHLMATVVWCTRVQDAYQIGIKFAPLNQQNQNYLSLFMQFLENGHTDEEHEDESEPESHGQEGLE